MLHNLITRTWHYGPYCLLKCFCNWCLVWHRDICWVEVKNISKTLQVTLEHGLELGKSTYVWIFFFQ